ncbi:MAG TPA: alpha/beta hydrolase [Candidatus Limnocylindrales bacterium]|nr:alpha/beta hydrolase [Candidatus Limnocylindrales bacterium]
MGTVLAPDADRVDTTRARQPDETGFIRRDGVRIYWERYGDGRPTVLLMPTWSLFHSRHWKMQIAYLARLFRVVTFDGRGNGRSDRPAHSDAYADTEYVADALAVLDATGTDRAVVIGLSMGAGDTLRLAAEQPGRVIGAVFIGSSIPILDRRPDDPELQVRPEFEGPQPDDPDWGNYNASYWRRDFPGFAAWFVGEKIFTEPHSTKPIEDGIGWTLETDAETLVTVEYGPYLWPPAEWSRGPGEGRAIPFARRVRCPALVIHGDDDHISPLAVGQRLADELDSQLLTIAGGGHAPQARWPVLVNRAIRDFLRTLPEGSNDAR